MSCSLCKDISFLPLRETKFAFRNDANEALRAEYADRLFYFHHCCLPCVLKASQQGCQLCTLIHACLRLFNINGSSEDGLCAVLDLPDAGVWVILTQYRGKHSKVSQSIDGQTFVSITGDTNWSGHFTIHYGRFSATMDLSSLPPNLSEINQKSPPQRVQNRRFEDSDAGFKSSMGLAVEWLQDCFQNHKLCLPSADKHPVLPTRVIYIDKDTSVTPHLLETHGKRGLYATLSYCWGEKEQFQLKEASYVELLRVIPVKQLSRTIQDAIKVTRGLGLQYLWADALCIIQDSQPDKLTQTAVMGDIYHHSTITIGAACGDHADAGLFADRDARARRPCPVYQVERDGCNHQIFAHLPEDNYQRTNLDTRGWVFQEKVLAILTLTFCPDGLQWSCIMICASEAVPHGMCHPPTRLEYRIGTWIHNPTWKPSWLDPKHHYFEDWYEAVSNFSARRLKYQTDKLPALAGLATWMKRLHDFQYVAGLWEEDLEYGLLWYVGYPAKETTDAYAWDPQRSLVGEEYYSLTSAKSKIEAGNNSEQNTPFHSEKGLTPAQIIWLKMNLLNLEESEIQPPSWSWVSLGQEKKVNFLYSHLGLTSQGHPLSRCLEVKCTPSSLGNPYIGASGGHIFLQGHLKGAFVMPGHADGFDERYLAPNMLAGCWPGMLIYQTGEDTGEIMGFIALDEDPKESEVPNKEVAILLLREDGQDREDGVRSNKVPLMLNYRPDGRIAWKSGNKRYLTGLTLKSVSSNNATIFRRVGLCQLYHDFWEEELKDPAKAKFDVLSRILPNTTKWSDG